MHSKTDHSKHNSAFLDKSRSIIMNLNQFVQKYSNALWAYWDVQGELDLLKMVPECRAFYYYF